MIEITAFAAAGGALGITVALLNGRQLAALGMLAWLYLVALAVCVLIGNATQVEVTAHLAPYVLLLAGASLVTAALAVRWPALAPRVEAADAPAAA